MTLQGVLFQPGGARAGRRGGAAGGGLHHAGHPRFPPQVQELRQLKDKSPVNGLGIGLLYVLTLPVRGLDFATGHLKVWALLVKGVEFISQDIGS
jgi:hypothetical protein